MNFTTKTENKIKLEKIDKIKDADICEYRVKIVFDSEESPRPYSIIWDEEQIDIYGFWSSKTATQHNITPDWYMRTEESRTASGMPLICLYNKANINRATIALSDPSSPMALKAGVVEETGAVRVEIELFSQTCSKMKEYEVVIRIDRRPIPFYEAVKGVRAWWNTLGYKCAHTPTHAKLPMYSTWYSLHQSTLPERIINECKNAKAYGMDTVIVDDGWQTDDNSRGYAFCGDWQVCESKIPDMKKLVDDIHALGMKLMVWFSVPFVGMESKNYARFKGKYLRINHRSRAGVLDPRFKEVRDFLTDTYATAVEKYGWDGLKLDFIDSFGLSEESSTEYDKMDTMSVEEALQRLLEEATEKLKRINPEILIEFRQSYVGPAISKYGNMFRAADCPNDAIYNRVHCLNLRLTSGTTAVHSDMIMWNKDDKNESVMYQLLGVLFAVPQISVRFDEITDEHKRLLAAYLGFWREHGKTLLEGELVVRDVDANYSMAQSKKDGECVAVLYQNVVKTLENVECEYIFNCTGADKIYIDAPTAIKYEIYDIFGKKYSSGELPLGPSMLPVRDCEMVKLFH